VTLIKRRTSRRYEVGELHEAIDRLAETIRDLRDQAAVMEDYAQASKAMPGELISHVSALAQSLEGDLGRLREVFE
jgi:argininosuccinate lyase